LQYLSVVPVFLGANLEFAVRLIPAIASLLTLAAIWKLAHRAGGMNVACIAVALSSLSLWEIEFARFGRMYSPFQAMFLWYAWFQLKHLLDRDRVAQVLYLILSGVSIFIYAGAALLLALNFLPLLWPGKRWDARNLVISSGLMFFGLYYYRTDFRFMGIPESLLPPGPTIDDSATTTAPPISLPIEIPFLPGTGFTIIAVGLFVFAILVWGHRRNLKLAHPSAILWLLTAVVTSFGLIAFGVALAFIAVLLRVPLPIQNTEDMRGQLVRNYAPGLVVLTTIIFLNVVAVGPDFISAAKNALNYLFNYPDVYYKILQPWLSAIPITTVLLAALIAPLFLLSLGDNRINSGQLDPTRYLFSILIVLVLLVGALKQPYISTRYTYFLYPILLVLASVSIRELTRKTFQTAPRRARWIIISIPVLFLFTEDFSAKHLIRINEPDIRFRLQYSHALSAHYYNRWDFRNTGDYINRQISPGEDVIVFHQALAHYLHQIDGIFIRKGSTIHSIVWGCGGTRELWSNAPLLDENHEVYERIMSGVKGTWLIMHTPQDPWRDPLETELIDRFELEPRYISIDGNLAVYYLSNAGQK
jgi:hypothetical protein